MCAKTTHLCIAILLLLSSLADSIHPALPWDTPQQNDDFLHLLHDKPPVGINIFSHYDATTGVVPDARGLDYDVAVTVENPEEEKRFPPEDGTFVMSDSNAVKATMTVSDAVYGNGVYELNFSPGATGADNRNPKWLFHPSPTETEYSHFDNSYSNSGIYEGSESLYSTDKDSYYGSYISIKSTHCLSMKTSQMKPRPGVESRSPAFYRIYARMYDTDAWTPIHDQPQETPEVDSIVGINVGDKCYLQHALVVNKLWSSSPLNFAEWRITGKIILQYVETTPAGSFNAANEVTSLYGTKDVQLTWPRLLAQTFTFCWATRYHSATSHNSKIMGTVEDASSMGHDGAKRGRARYQSIYYRSPAHNINGPVTDWLVVCLTNKRPGAP